MSGAFCWNPTPRTHCLNWIKISGLHASSTAILTFGSILKSETAQAWIHLSGRWESNPADLMSNITASCMTIFIGREFFAYLAAVVSRYHSVDEASIRGRVKEVFHRSFPEYENVFPPHTTFYFSNEHIVKAR